MSIKQLRHENPSWGATLIVLLVVAALMTIVGVAVWLYMAPQGTPTQPDQAGKPHSELRLSDTATQLLRTGNPRTA